MYKERGFKMKSKDRIQKLHWTINVNDRSGEITESFLLEREGFHENISKEEAQGLLRGRFNVLRNVSNQDGRYVVYELIPQRVTYRLDTNKGSEELEIGIIDFNDDGSKVIRLCRPFDKVKK